MENKTEKDRKIHGKALGQMEMQCSRLMKNVWGLEVGEKVVEPRGMALAEKPDLGRGCLAGSRNLSDKMSWWKPLQ